MKNIIVLLSGGMDSTTVLGMIMSNKNQRAIPVFFNYGQTYLECEREAVTALCKHYNKILIEVPLPFYTDMEFTTPLITGKGVIKVHHMNKEMVKNIIPFRNAILLSLATALASEVYADMIAIGVHGGEIVYPDCRPDFLNAMAQAIRIGTDNKVELYTPLAHLSIQDVLRIGTRLDVPYQLTHSCYTNSLIHCGLCGGCSERKDRFKITGIPDPTEYEYKSNRKSYKPGAMD